MFPEYSFGNLLFGPILNSISKNLISLLPSVMWGSRLNVGQAHEVGQKMVLSYCLFKFSSKVVKPPIFAIFKGPVGLKRLNLSKQLLSDLQTAFNSCFLVVSGSIYRSNIHKRIFPKYSLRNLFLNTNHVKMAIYRLPNAIERPTTI